MCPSSPTVNEMANLGQKNGVYVARFRYRGKEYKKSLKTSNSDHASAALRRVEDTLHWLTIGALSVPSEVDAGDFILSGGTFRAPVVVPRPRLRPTLQDAVSEYLASLRH